MPEGPNNPDKPYFYFDVECQSCRIVGWGTETRGEVETQLSHGFHRLFVSRGQYNKLVAEIEKSR